MAQYDDIADEYVQFMNPTKRFVQIPFFTEFVGDVAGLRVADLACGDGIYARIFARQGAHVVGVDISEKILAVAKQKEAEHPLGITYRCQDARQLNLGMQFDKISAVYLLNYAGSRDDLGMMLRSIHDHLRPGGSFFAVTIDPLLTPMVRPEYGRIFFHPEGNSLFSDGDTVRCEVREEGKPPFSFESFYWSKETYDRKLTEAGFHSIEWEVPQPSAEGIAMFGETFWEGFRKNHSTIGIRCKK